MCLEKLLDKRGCKGRIYALAPLLTIAVLAKLAGRNQIRSVAHWAKLQARNLTNLFDLPNLTMPHHTTWSRILGEAMDINQFKAVIAGFFAKHLTSQVPARGSLVLAIDGKALRGTIPGGQTQGRYLMAAYLVGYGVVLAQIEVGCKENEIVAAPKLLAHLDLTGLVVVGDAMQCQRELSVKVVSKKGDFLWFLKENQPGAWAEVQDLFEAKEPLAKGHSPSPNDFVTARTIEKSPIMGTRDGLRNVVLPLVAK